jgi:hypothetical protein
VDGGQLRVPQPGEGVTVTVPGGALVSGGSPKWWPWVLAHFHVGSHAGNVTCRSCGALTWPEPPGMWSGEHNVKCPTAAEMLTRWPPVEGELAAMVSRLEAVHRYASGQAETYRTEGGGEWRAWQQQADDVAAALAAGGPSVVALLTPQLAAEVEGRTRAG